MGSVMVLPPIMTPIPSGVGADQAAWFIAIGPAITTDENADSTELVFEADPRYGALPDWAAVVDGNVVLTEDAGTVAYSVVGVADMDFSGTTPPDADGAVFFGVRVQLDAVMMPFRTSGPYPGDGQDAQTTGKAKDGSTGAPEVISVVCSVGAYADPENLEPINDGVAVPRVGLTVTRVGQAAALPEGP